MPIARERLAWLSRISISFTQPPATRCWTRPEYAEFPCWRIVSLHFEWLTGMFPGELPAGPEKSETVGVPAVRIWLASLVRPISLKAPKASGFPSMQPTGMPGHNPS